MKMGWILADGLLSLGVLVLFIVWMFKMPKSAGRKTEDNGTPTVIKFPINQVIVWMDIGKKKIRPC